MTKTLISAILALGVYAQAQVVPTGGPPSGVPNPPTGTVALPTGPPSTGGTQPIVVTTCASGQVTASGVCVTPVPTAPLSVSAPSNTPAPYNAPPPQFFSGQFAGVAIQQATLESFLQQWLAQVTHVSTLTLMNEGVTGPQMFPAIAWQVTLSVCNEGNPPDCANMVSLANRYGALAQAAYANVPATQWNASTYSANAIVPPAPPPGPAIQPPANPVGVCYLDAVAVQIKCYGAPGLNPASVSDGSQVVSNGKFYIAHVSQALMGPSVYFTPQN